ncbi:MAG: hypothetical protein A3F33_04000 [Candidatus Woykebacteria bacterium RIFCSPHIGHO2_12_FULL_43_10]|uniref:PilN domain-containing protein n=2 Tax=Candidatus Woykeibacteriota TaxID=1817899 RepID=A0A1G1WYG4_9BACT|nr:MAG: hypothetical protein A2802_00765 [Candidatus Woykebacteria bacterium RIFCSPHIGHO2_01_FULL_43_29]OGY28559.1 MAG: hypothetical protein A3J50_03965 [Candidatus Woykebacteria bacterium RIFCSPHIGHO2_02_FULL_43_16b]OGY29054.1 MAG: hypothetical protein A3F33_04000 [Candidatus Woykebacteria bacterium RIFCSPHIGHO2_12_FULL_43_10]OGY32177.1 MAG: hypothetical protein A3A61_01520 [Candidatus Woykebacteria bacterium RIFCSPLOWO2_01_FULL_43_14]
MPKKQINLIPKTSETEIKEQSQKRKFRVFSIVVLILVILLMAFFYLVEAYLNLSIASVKDQNARSTATLKGLNENESVLRGIEAKLIRYRAIQSEYPEYPRLFKMVSDASLGLVDILGVVVEKDHSMEITVESVDKSAMASFLGVFNTLALKNNFRETQIKELNAQPQKSYKIILSFRW